MSTYGSPVFMSLERVPEGSRLTSIAVGYATQAAFVALLLIYAIASPKLMPTQISHIELVAPSPDLSPKPLPVKVAKIQPVIKRAHDLLPAAVTPKIQAPVLMVQQPQRIRRIVAPAEMAQPEVAIASPKFDSKVLNALPGPRTTPKVVTSTNFGGSSATATLQHVAPSKVQTGGFGDPNGVPVNAKGNGRSNIAAAGSFDLPSGAGYGNGTGGASGARGTVTSAGFGSGTAVQGGGGRGGNAAQGRIQATGFNAAVSTPAPTDAAHRASAAAHLTSAPVSIQSKPNPVYTSEARQHKVEGEVLLNVVFLADGRIRILNVVRGLGYGLDEAAQRAVQGLKFTPALRDGHPIDSSATLHVIFQLS
jgi:TonB family protein